MSFSVVITPEASEELKEIYRYIAYHFRSPITAERWFDRLTQAALSLAVMPERNHLFYEEPWFSIGVRVMNIGNYSILYQVNSETEEVSVLHFLYGRRDIVVILEKDSRIR